MAMVMPLIGFDEVADQPADARRHGDEQKSEDDHEDRGEKFANRPVCAPGIGWNVSSTHIIAITASDANHHKLHRQIAFDAPLAYARAASRGCARTSFSPAVSARPNRRHRFRSA